MAEAEKDQARVPAALENLLNGYLNTCRVMSRLWRRGTAVLLLGTPLAFLGAGYSGLDAAISGVGLWIALTAISRFLVFEFRQSRAGRVARRIERRIPPDHPSYDAMIEWIARHNDGNYLNSVLKELGVPPRTAGAYATPLPETVVPSAEKVQEFAEKLMSGRGSGTQSENVQTHVYTSSQTLVLNEDGEWVTLQSETSDGGDPVAPTEAMQKALEIMARGYAADVDLPERTAEPPPGFEPIPLGSPVGGTAREKQPGPSAAKRRKPRRKGRSHMPLQFEEFRPHDDEDDREEIESAACPAEDER